MPKRVQLPDGSIGEFPDNMADGDIEKVLQKQYGPPQQESAPAAGGVLGTLADVGRGMYKGVGSTVAGLNSLASSIPGVGKYLATPTGQALQGHVSTPQEIAANQQTLNQQTTATNTAQKVGKFAEQAGEFLIPGAGEERLALKVGELAPALGKIAPRIAAKALGAGVVNSAQQGTPGAFVTGAALGGVGEGVAQGMKAIAPVVAEKAIGVRAPDRAFNRTPGQAILDETTGLKPGTVAAQAGQKVGDLTGQMQDLVNSSTTPVDLGGARQIARDAYGTAVRQNAPSQKKEALALLQQLTQRDGTSVTPQTSGWGGISQKATPIGSPTPIPQVVPASMALDLKRGIGAEVNSWNPATVSTLASGAQKAIYGNIDSALDAAAPGTEALNQRISTLIPVAARAGATDLNEGVIGRSIGRLGKPTGALIGAGIGAEEGRRNGGAAGAVAGGLAGLVAPELISNPTALMVIARGGNSPFVSRYAVPALAGSALQFTRKKGEQQ